MVFHPLWHYAFDLLAYGACALVFRWQLFGAKSVNPALQLRGYWLSLTIGAVSGAYLFGSWNLTLASGFQLGHSLAGAVAGGILGAEGFKLARGIRGSTGAIFVLSLCTGIVIGRLGCFFAGLPDHTFGTPSSLPWAVDFGDGVRRHPVQLYESLSMAVFLVFAILLKRKNEAAFQAIGFYFFVFYYAAQRFLWEFLKPYATVFGNLNLFHLLCIALALYAAGMAGSWLARER